MRSQRGFTLVEGLLIFIIVGMLGGIGWYVYSTKKQTTETLKDANAANNSMAVPKTDPTAGWTAYTSQEGGYSLKYPAKWQRPDNEELCTEGLLMLGPTKDAAGRCGSEAFGQIIFLSVEVGNVEDYKIKVNEGYKDVKSEKVTVNGVEGIRQSGVAAGQKDTNPIAPLPDNTKVVGYVFTANGRIYAAVYKQTPTDADLLSDFDLIVTKTLKFSS